MLEALNTCLIFGNGIYNTLLFSLECETIFYKEKEKL